MPYYEYRCAANGQTVEVRHGMDQLMETWGDLVEKSGIGPGTTPADTPVERILSAPVPLTGSTSDRGFQGCGAGCACAPQA